MNITEGFNLLATAPDGIKRLRELILSLAVQGKLLPQDPSDQPASELLKQIRAEKDRLIAEGEIRKGKEPQAIDESELMYDLPSGWQWARLGQLGDWGAGATPSRGNSDYYGGDIPWFKSGELTADYINKSEETVTKLALKECSLRFNKVGDVLIAMYGATIGKTAILDIAGTTNQAVCACTPFCGLDRSYLLLVLKAMKPHFIGLGAGGAQPNISREKIIATIIGLPPLAEQARIVAKVEELMALCDALEASGRLENAQHARLVGTLFDALANSVRGGLRAGRGVEPHPSTSSGGTDHLQENWQRVGQAFDLLLDRPAAIDTLEQTILQLAVRGLLVAQDPTDQPASELLKQIRAEKDRLILEGKIKKDKPLAAITDEEKPFELPDGWEWVRFGDSASISSGVTLGRKTAIPDPVLLPYLRVANVQRWKLILNDVKELIIDKSELARFSLQHGDLLITEGGDWDKVGRTCVWEDNLPTCLHQNHVFKVRAVYSEWNYRWAELYLNSTDARAYFASSAKQTTNLASINMTQLKNCLFPVPPLVVQARIVARVEALRALCFELRTRLTASQKLQTHLAETLVEQSKS